MKITKLPQIRNKRLCSNCNNYANIKIDPNSNNRGMKLCYKCIDTLIRKLSNIEREGCYDS